MSALSPIAAAHRAIADRKRAERQATCEHRGLFWYLAACNEDGWRCVDCDLRPGEPAGYSPQHDRSHLRVKVWSILHDLHEAGFIYASNSDHGEWIVSKAATECDRDGIRDQYGIIAVILRQLAPEHTAYWTRISDGVMSGKDERDRCPCGALADLYSSDGKGQRTKRCSQHAPMLFDDSETDDELRARLAQEAPHV